MKSKKIKIKYKTIKRAPRVFLDKDGKRYIRQKNKKVYIKSKLSNKQLIKIVINNMTTKTKRRQTAAKKPLIESKHSTNQPEISAITTSAPNIREYEIKQDLEKVKREKNELEIETAKKIKDLEKKYKVEILPALKAIEGEPPKKLLKDKEGRILQGKKGDPIPVLDVDEVLITYSNGYFKVEKIEELEKILKDAADKKTAEEERMRAEEDLLRKEEERIRLEEEKKKTEEEEKKRKEKEQLKKYFLENRKVSGKSGTTSSILTLNAKKELDKILKLEPLKKDTDYNTNRSPEYYFYLLYNENPENIKNINDNTKNKTREELEKYIIKDFKLIKKEEREPMERTKEELKPMERTKEGEQEDAEYNPIGPEPQEGQGGSVGLWDYEIENLMKPYKKDGFLGVISSDEIKSLLPRIKKNNKYSFIMNLDKSSQPGSHWVAVYIDPIDSLSIEYYDPFGTDPSPQFQKDIIYIVDKLKPNLYLKFKINRIIDQNIHSKYCGWHSMAFIINRLNGHQFKEITKYNAQKGEVAAEKLKIKFNYI